MGNYHWTVAHFLSSDMATGNRGTIKSAHYKVILYNSITAGALIFTVDDLELFFANVLLGVVC